MPKLITSETEKKNLRWDAKRKLWVGWQIDIYVNQGPGRRLKRYRTTYPTETDARTAESRLRVKSENIRLGIETPDAGRRRITLKEVFEKRLAEIPEERRRKFIKRILEYFLALLPPGVYLEDLRTADFSLYETTRAKEKTVQRDAFITPQTIHREMTEISAAVRRAPVFFRELEAWVCPPIRRPKITDSRRERVITEAEKKALIEYFARPRARTENDEQHSKRVRTGHEFEFACLTSSRRKEVAKLKWSDYFPDRDLLRITRWKTIKSKKQSVTQFSPLPVRVREILELRRAESTGEYIFSESGEISYGYLQALKTACKKLSIPYGRFTDGGLIFHDTRHTFVTTLIENNTDIETARELSGLSREMILRYAHSSPEKKRRAIESLDGDRRREKLRIIFEKIQNKEIDFEQFLFELNA